MLGKRQPEIYGTQTLSHITTLLKDKCKKITKSEVEITDFQSNSESDLVQFINDQFELSSKQPGHLKGMIINPASLSHTSVSIRDALEMLTATSIPLVEVHLSNIFAREKFRHHSFVSSIADAVISGLKSEGYLAALNYLLKKQPEADSWQF